MDVTDYLPWLTVSLIVWNMLLTVVTDADHLPDRRGRHHPPAAAALYRCMRCAW